MAFFIIFPFCMAQPVSYLDRLSQNRIAQHLLFWLFVLFLVLLEVDQQYMEVWKSFVYRGVGLPTKILATYFLAYYLIPNFFQKEKYFQFAFYLVGSSIVFCIIYRFNNVHVAEVWAGDSEHRESLWEIIIYWDETILGYIGRVYSMTIPFIFIKMLRSRGAEKRKLELLEREKISAELNFLKAQIHPHFLFNTLNNLYALTRKKSDAAPEVVSKLSDMLDYMLYQCNENTVLIFDEIALLQNYIDLEKLRYGDRLQLKFDAAIDSSEARIAPLILISVVENAFKHGVSGAIKAPKINIRLTEKKGILKFHVYNTMPNIQQVDETDFKKGVGVSNVKRQLELIYPKKYRLEILDLPGTYEVNLTIWK